MATDLKPLPGALSNSAHLFSVPEPCYPVCLPAD